MTDTDTEKAKYESIWELDSYRNISPAVRDLDRFFEFCAPKPPEVIVDLGCGTGQASLMLHQKGFPVLMVDIARNCLSLQPNLRLIDVDNDPDLWPFLFMEACLWDLPPMPCDWVISFDVLEHLPEDKIDTVFKTCKKMTRKGCFFQIALFESEQEGHVLHLTVKPAEWWLEKLRQYFDVKIYRATALHLYAYVA